MHLTHNYGVCIGYVCAGVQTVTVAEEINFGSHFQMSNVFIESQWNGLPYKKIWSRNKVQVKISFSYVIFTGNTFRHVRKISKNGCWLRQVCPSVHFSVRQHATTRVPLDGFSWNLLFEFFRRSVEKIQVLLKCDRNKGHFTWIPIYIYEKYHRIRLRMRKVSDKICKENQNTFYFE